MMYPTQGVTVPSGPTRRLRQGYAHADLYFQLRSR